MLIFILLFSNFNLFTLPPSSTNTILADSTTNQEFSELNNIQESQTIENINKLDGFFTANYGQVKDESVKYYIHGKGVWFLNDGVVFEITESSRVGSPKSGSRESMELFNKPYPDFESDVIEPIKSVAIKLNFEGCNEVKPKGIGLLSHKSNFFYGNDSSKWCTNVPNFQEVIYKNIYNDIDLKYYNSKDGLKYDFIVRPSGKVDDIRLKGTGIEELQIDSDNNMILQTNLGNIIDSELFIYQSNMQEGKIEGRFKLIDLNIYGFEIIGDYEKDRPLIIDPNISSTYLGGYEEDVGWAVTGDSYGNAYVTGFTSSNDFPNTTGANDTIHNGNRDIFVLKLNPDGTSPIFSTYIGGNDSDRGGNIAIDSNGNAYVTGDTHSTNFPTTFGAFDTSFNGIDDVFVLKLNHNGSKLLYSTYIGGNHGDGGGGIVIDSDNNVWVAGSTFSNDFPNTTGAINNSHNGGDIDAFVFKLNSIGSSLLYSTYIGGSEVDGAADIAIDSSNNIYVTGMTYSPDFPITSGAYNDVINGTLPHFFIYINMILCSV
jgi:hypothetical protein